MNFILHTSSDLVTLDEKVCVFLLCIFYFCEKGLEEVGELFQVSEYFVLILQRNSH